jgi:hypothetical protein
MPKYYQFITSLLLLVGDNATDEVRVSHVQVLHQLVQLLPVCRRDGLVGGTLLLLATATLYIHHMHLFALICTYLYIHITLYVHAYTVHLKLTSVEAFFTLRGLSEEQSGQGLLGDLEKADDRLVDWILILVEPTVDVVGDCAGVVSQLEVTLELGALLHLGLGEVGRLAKVVLVQLGQERLVRRFGEHALLLQDGQDTHRLHAHITYL